MTTNETALPAHLLAPAPAVCGCRCGCLTPQRDRDNTAALAAHLSSIRADMRQPCALYLVAGLAQAVTIARTGTA